MVVLVPAREVEPSEVVVLEVDVIPVAAPPSEPKPPSPILLGPSVVVVVVLVAGVVVVGAVVVIAGLVSVGFVREKDKADEPNPLGLSVVAGVAVLSVVLKPKDKAGFVSVCEVVAGVVVVAVVEVVVVVEAAGMEEEEAGVVKLGLLPKPNDKLPVVDEPNKLEPLDKPDKVGKVVSFFGSVVVVDAAVDGAVVVVEEAPKLKPEPSDGVVLGAEVVVVG